MPPSMVKTVTIQAGTSLSNVIDLSDGTAIFIHMPMDWTPALLSFQLSPDSTNFTNAVDMNAREIAYNVKAGTTIRLGQEWSSSAVGFMRLRSGTADFPIAQEQTRNIMLSGVTTTVVGSDPSAAPVTHKKTAREDDTG